MSEDECIKIVLVVCLSALTHYLVYERGRKAGRHDGMVRTVRLWRAVVEDLNRRV